MHGDRHSATLFYLSVSSHRPVSDAALSPLIFSCILGSIAVVFSRYTYATMPILLC